MRIKDLLGIVIRVKRILEVYADSKLEDMLDDIYMKVQSAGVVTDTSLPVGDRPLVQTESVPENVEKKGSAKVIKSGKKKKDFNPLEIAETLPGLSKDEITVILNEFTISQIRTVATLLQITIPGTAKRKGEIIDFIANFFGMNQVHKQMSHR